MNQPITVEWLPATNVEDQIAQTRMDLDDAVSASDREVLAARLQRLQAERALIVHRQVWDMPSLAERHPEVLNWLMSRFEVHFGMMSEVIIEDLVERRVRPFATNDVRVALETLLVELTA